MSEQFRIGEIAVHVADVTISTAETLAYDGQDCKIIGALTLWPTWEQDGSPSMTLGYNCLCADGFEIIAAPHELRKKRPPEPDEAAYRQAMLDCIQKAKQPVMVPA